VAAMVLPIVLVSVGGPFFSVGIIVVVIALVTVSFQSIKSVDDQPSKSLQFRVKHLGIYDIFIKNNLILKKIIINLVLNKPDRN
jgi:hypothetical protein